MRENRLVYFCFLFFGFTFNCFAYEIKFYSGQQPSEQAEGVFNLVFCPLSYQSKDDFLKDIDILIQRLSQTRPFDEFIKEIGFYYVAISREEENMIFKRRRGFPPLKVRKDFLDDILSYLKSNYKLVEHSGIKHKENSPSAQLIIINASGSVSCAELSSIDKLSLIILGRARYANPQSFAKGFLHELGHSLSLRDECVVCEQLCPPGPPNCATTKEEAEKWWGDLVGKEARVNYIRGCCGNKDYIRPIIASLMNDPDKAEDFGPVNERYLRQIYNNPK